MFKKILFPTDFSKHANEIFKNIPELRSIGVREIVLTKVIDLNEVLGIKVGFDLHTWLRHEEIESRRSLSKLAEFLQQHGLNAKYTIQLPIGDPATEIVNYATRERVSMILIGSRGKSVTKDILIGSVCEGVIRRAKTPVLIVKNSNTFSKLFNRVIYAHDLSRYSDEIFEYVKFIALLSGGEVIILHVLEGNAYRSAVKSKLNSIKKQLENEGVDVNVHIIYGAPHREIVKASEELNATIIMVGPRGLNERPSLGSVTDSVIRYSKIPIFLYKN